MRDVDDTELMSYADGELDAVTAREVEAVLFRDPVRAAQVRELRAGSALVRSAFNHVLHGAPPLSAPAAPARPRAARVPVALAASLAALAVGLAVGAAAPWAPAGAGDADAVRAAALQQSLEGRPSGVPWSWIDDASGETGRVVPVSSYRSESGRFCREFEEVRVVDGASRREAGVACRGEDGRWRVRVRYYP